MFQKAYEDVTKHERGLAKAPVLGCFGGDTEVLTDRGWLKITAVTLQHRLFDGVEFVQHDGLIDQGVKQIIDLCGTQVTADHLILTEEGWQCAEDVSRNIRFVGQAIALAGGQWSDIYEGRRSEEPSTISVAAEAAETPEKFTPKIWSVENLAAAFRALTRKLAYGFRAFMNASMRRAMFSTVSPIAIMPLPRGVVAQVELGTDTATEVSNAASRMFMPLSNTAFLCPVTVTPESSSIAKTTTATTKSATFASYLPRKITGTRKNFAGSTTKEADIARPNFGSGSPLGIAATPLSAVKYERGSQPNKSLPIKQNAEVRTFDILNCGPRSRFVFRTLAGPMIAHNCGYRLSGGELKEGKRTGLWAYAESMGINMTKEQSHKAVDVFRSVYPEIPQHWYDHENAFRKAMASRQPVKIGLVTYEYRKPYLTMTLPSGRSLFYFQPRVTATEATSRFGKPYTKMVLSYMGQHQKTKKWTRIETHGGKLTENEVQAVARDVLRDAMLKTHREGYNIVAHVHDEIICLQKKGDNRFTLEGLRDIMKSHSPWMTGLPLGAEGWQGQFYRK